MNRETGSGSYFVKRNRVFLVSDVWFGPLVSAGVVFPFSVFSEGEIFGVDFLSATAARNKLLGLLWVLAILVDLEAWILTVLLSWSRWCWQGREDAGSARQGMVARMISLTNNRMGARSLKNGTSQVGSKGWNWWGGSIQDPWYAGLHTRAAQTRAKRAFLSSSLNKP